MNVLCSSLSDIRAKSVIVVLRILASDTMMWLNHHSAIILDTIKFNQFTLTSTGGKDHYSDFTFNNTFVVNY